MSATTFENTYALSPMQQGMLFHALFVAQPGVDVEQMVCRFHEQLDIPTFERAWRRVVAQHAVLRTAFRWQGLEEPLQEVHREVDITFTHHDVRGIPAEQVDARVQDYLREDRRAGFDMSRPPLMRFALFREAEAEIRFVWTFHHILLDGRSFSLVIRDVFACYEALLAGAEPTFEARRPYADFIAWLGARDTSAAAPFWRQLLAGFRVPTPLLGDRPAARRVEDIDYGEQTAYLSPATTAALLAVAREHKLTLNVFLQGAWGLLLSRYAGETDVVFAVTRACRRTALGGVGTEAMLGVFINTLPVRAQVKPDLDLISWLREIQEQGRSLRDHEHTPLVQVRESSELPANAPMFESLLVFEELILDATLKRLGGAWANRDFKIVRQTSFPLMLIAYGGPALTLELEYDKRRLDDAVIARMLGHLRTLLEAMAVDPLARVGDLPILTAPERTQLVETWNATSYAYPEDACIHEVFEAQAARTPDSIALVFEGQALCYRALNARMNQLAHALRKRGVGPEVMVGVCMERSIEMVVSLYAILKAGGAYVPFDPDYPKDRLAFMLEDTQISVVLTQAHLASVLPEHGAEVIRVDSEWATIAAEPEENPARAGLSIDSLAYTIFTSGSTGRPKGAMNAHRGVLNRLRWGQRTYPLDGADRTLQKTPFSFDVSVYEFFWPMLFGATLVVARPEGHKDPAYLAALIEQQGITTTHFVPSMLKAFLDEISPGRCSTLERVFCSGEALSPAMVDAFFAKFTGLELHNLYGPTEAGVEVTYHDCHPGEAIVPIGRPVDNTQIYLLDQRMEPVPIGVRGELYIGGIQVARGYLNRPELTAERFVHDPFSAVPGNDGGSAPKPPARLYRTGDVARHLPSGDIEYVGRADFQVKIRGFRIELGEIETVLGRHPDVREVIVVVREDTPGDQRIIAYLVLADDAPTTAELRAFLRERLPEYMEPSVFVPLLSLPLLASGKVDRKALPAPELHAEGRVFVAPRGPVEEAIAAIFAEVLSVDEVSAHDGFFALGGHSLLATRVASRLRAGFGVDLPVRLLFEASTPAALAAYVEARIRDGNGGEAATPPLALAPRDGVLPLSFAQERMWLLDQLDPGDPTYIIPRALRLRGKIDVAALERSVRDIVTRHEVLRTTFSKVDGRAVPVIHASVETSVPVTRWPSVPVAGRESLARKEAEAEAHRPFDFVTGPLFRVRLLEIDAEDHLLTLMMHHIVSDAWTLEVWNAELAALYRGHLSGTAASLPELPIQYLDYAVWQRRGLDGKRLDEQLSYWKKRLDGAEKSLDLPFDHPRQAVASRRGAKRRFSLPAELATGLKQLSRKNGSTLFMTLLAAFDVLLLRYTGQGDLSVGTPVANRGHAETEGLIGFFLNTLVLRTEVEEDLLFSELVKRVKEACLGAYAHQDIPFERLVQELDPERDLARTPLFQVMFTLESPTREAMTLPGLTLSREDVESGTSKFDLTLWMQDSSSDLSCWIEYATDLFEPTTIARMEGHLRTLLGALVQAPDCRVRDLSILDEAERRTVLVDWNATAFAYPDDAAIHEVFEAQAARAPDAIALVFEEKTLTYRELNARANQLAHALRKRGVGPGVLVGVCLERSIEMVVALHAILKAGGAYVPFDPEYPKDRLAFMLEDTQVPVVLTQAHLEGTLPAHGAAVIRLDSEWESMASQPRENPARAGLTLDTLAYAIYTSGSTGRPKGALNAHRGILNRLQWMQRTYPLGASDRVLQKTPFSFDVSVWEFFWPLMFGATLVVAKPEGHKDPAYLAELIEAQGITTTHFVPSMLKAFLDDLPRGRCASLARVFCSGEALPPAMVEAFFAKVPGTELHNLYGPTEAAVDVTYFACHAGDVLVPIGRPVDNTQIYLLDDRMEPVAVGVRGELYIGGVQVGRGYLNRPELTAERFLDDPFSAAPGARLYRTGDVARHLTSGQIDYLGRADFQVKIRGFRIELGEIEAVLAAHPAVRDVTVVAREDVVPGQKRLVGYLVCAEGQAPTVGELRAFLKDRLPEYMVPSAFVLLAAMPLSSSGKVNRRALPAPEDGTRAETGAEFVAPRSEAEEALSRIWAGILRLPTVGIHDNFFELGGDSILSIQVVARALQAGLHLTPRQLFQHPTVAELAAVAGAKSTVVAEQGPVTGAAPLTPVQRWWRELAPQDPQHWNQSIFLEAGETIDAAALEKAVSALLGHHDALRLRLVGGEQVFAPPGDPAEIVHVNLSALAGAEQTAALEKAAAEVQGSLDLEHGPVIRVALFDLGESHPQRLLVVIHHLAVDGISWRILVEDLWTAYSQAARGQVISLPAKTTSARRWAELLVGRAGSTEVVGEEAYWIAGASRTATRLPVDHADGANTEGSARSITVTLTAEETEALLRRVPEAYQTQINDVLLTAFTQAMSAWTGGAGALFDLEGHGREDLFEGVDLTRTVGWFTTVYPVLLQLDSTAPPGEALKSVKEQLRAVPGNGLGHGLLRYLHEEGHAAALLRAAPPAEVSFNYLGQRDQMLPEGAPLRLATESAGPAASPRAQRRYLLDVLGRVTGGVLSVRWIYSESRHERATIEALAGRFVAALRALVAHCLSPDAGGYTPSDFRRASLAQPAIDRLVAAEGGKKGLEDAYPLSPIQAGILFHTLYDASPEAYVVQLAWTLRGDIDIPTFTRAWQAVVDRHSILRTKFEHDDLDEPLQIVKRTVPVAIAQLDISALSPEDQAARIVRYSADDRQRGFDLTQAPLMRWSLLRLGDGAYRFIWSSHHLLLDGWSTQIVVKQVFALYDAFRSGDEPRLERVAPYGEYVGWIRGQSKAPVEAFWRDRLQGFSAPTPLGVDRPAGPGAGERYGELRFDLSEADSGLLAAFARKHKLTVSTLVQGAWALLLSRYSREDDVVFGSTMSGRSAAVPGIDRMVGLFINTLPVRAKIGPRQTTLAFLSQLQEEQSVLREYEHSPLVDVQGYSGVPRGTPLFESLLIFENYPVEESVQRGARGFSVSEARFIERPPYPLTVIAVFRSALFFRIGFDLARFDEATIARLTGHLHTLLLGMAAEPESLVAALPILPAAERHTLIIAWNATAMAYPQVGVHHLIEAQADARPDAVALGCDGAELTYRELDRRGNQLARYLQRRGAGPGTRIGISTDRSIDMVVAALAVMKSGAAYVPLDPTYPRDRLAFIAADAGLLLLLTQDSVAGEIAGIGGESVRIDAEWPTIAAESDARLEPVAPEAIAYVLYTSGSTGKPKGVRIPHRALVNFLTTMRAEPGFTASDRLLAVTSLSFDIAGLELFLPLVTGGFVEIASHAAVVDGAQLADLLVSRAITVMQATPSTWRLLLDDGWQGAPITVLVGGEAVPRELVDKLAPRVASVWNMYGPTETTIWSCIQRLQAGGTSVPIGRPIGNTQAYVLDSLLHPVPIGVAGELHLGGDGVALGYFDRPELTRERFIPSPFLAGETLYKTGDLCRFRDDGALEFLGRTDFQVKLRGYRIELGEIEAVLAQYPTVLAAATIVREDAPGDKRLVAYLITAKDSSLNQADLRAFLGAKLPAYMVPSAYVILAAMPLTPNGKLDRRALPAPEASAREADADFVAPRTAAEEALSRIWASVLRLPRVGIHDNFFELGGDSILSIQVVARSRPAGLHLTPRQLFQHPTVAELAAVAGAKSSAIAEQGAITGAAPLTPVQRWWGELAPQDPQHWNQSVFLEAGETIAASALEEAVSALLDHHDALRLRLAGGEQVFAPPGERAEIVQINLSALAGAEQTAALEKAAAEVQGTLDLERGPVIRVALFDLGESHPQRLLVVIHHLAVDGVSWRILLEDLWTAYTQVSRGKAVSLPAKTTSARRWAELLVGRAGSAEVAGEAAYWIAGASRTATRLPVDHADGGNTEGSARSITVTLTEEETEALLRKVPEAYQTQINDVLLTAFTQAMEAWTGGESALFDLEGHGREDLFEGVDLGRTVGWFTTVYPVLLQLAPGAGPGEALKSVKEQLRAVPGNGLGHGLLRYLRDDGATASLLRAAPPAEVSFNYLGQRDQMLPEGAPLRLATESAGPAASPRAQRRYLLDVLGRVTGGVLSVRWIYSANRHTEATIEALAGRFVAALRALVAHCLSPDAGGYTPSDFRRARLTQLAIDRLVAAEGGKKGLEDAYPLSPIQAGILFHTLYDASPETYILQIAWTLRGELDLPTFTRAWQAVVDRHPILRTRFEQDRLEEPLQIVKQRVPVAIAELDISALGPEEQAARIERYSTEDRRKGFDPGRAPLMRWSLLRLAPDAYRFVWSSHHLLLDGWSLQLVVKEAFALYDAFLRGDEPRLDHVAPYGEYIGWIRGHSQVAAEAFWRDRLQGFSAPTPLGVDRPAGPGAGERYSELRFDLSEADSGLLAAFARKHKLTVSTLVQGAWALLLSRYSREDDVVFGSTMSGRSASVPGIDRMVGLFINTLPVRVKIGPKQTTLAFLSQLQEEQSVLREHEHSPLVDVQGYSAVPRGTPLFESLLVFENYPIEESIKRGAKGFSATDPRVVERPPYPLTVIAVFRSTLFFRVGFDLARFDEATIARLTGHLHTLLLGMAAAPEGLLAALPILPAAERHTLITGWNATAFAYPEDACIHEVFEAQAARTPEAPALVFEGTTLSYGELNGRANRLAHALRKRGVGPDVLVGVCMDRSIEMIVALYGILKAGGAYVPFDPEYPKDRLAFMLEDTRVSVVLSQLHLDGVLPEHGAEVIRLDAEWTSIAGEPASDPARAGLSLDSRAYAIFTSGSTGRPKGALNAHRGILNRLQWMQRAYPLGAGDRVLQKTPFSFDVSVWELFWPLMVGATLVVARPDGHRDPAYLAALIEEQAVTTTHFVPSMLKAFVDDVVAGRCPSLTRVFCSGEALPPAMVEAFFARITGSELHNLYGPTEAAVDVTYFACHPGDAVVPIGRPVDNTQIYLLDDRMEPVPTGVRGELYIGGVQVGLGYLNRPELTAERFVQDPFSPAPGARLYRTGDVARYLSTGDIEYLGRADFQVKIRGFRIELGEIEAALGAHPGVSEAAVLAREDAPGEKRLVAYLLVHGDNAPSAGELRSFLEARLPAYMVPSAFVTLEAFPLSAAGKLDRRALPAPEGAGLSERVYVAPRGPVEESLAGIFAEVLRQDAGTMGAHDGFFELGGHSLLATQAMSRLRAAFGVELPLRSIFDAPTPAALARLVEGALGAGLAASVPPLRRAGDERATALSFAQERLWFLSQLDPNDPSYLVLLGMRLEGRLDRAALRRALAEIMRRHEVLRTTFASVKGKPHAVIHADLTLDLPETDLRALGAEERDEAVRQASMAEAKCPFDLGVGPLIRARLLAFGDDDHALFLSMHHVVADDWTLAVLTRELGALYAAFHAGEASPLAELEVQYADYALWQRRWLEGSALDEQLDYWTRHLEGAPRTIELPTDRPRPPVRSSRGGRQRFELGRELTDKLTELSRREGATLFMTLHAAFDVLLHRYTGQADIVVGSPIANRTRAETEGLLGLFINTMVLRVEVTPELSFKDLIGRVREVCLGAYAHQDMPFERLVQQLDPERDPSRSPLFQVIFNLQNAPGGGLDLPDLRLSPIAFNNPTVKTDLVLIMNEGPQGLRGSFFYSTELFDAATIDRLVAHFLTLLEGAVATPAAKIVDLPLLPGAELRRVVSQCNDTFAAYAPEATVHGLFEERAARTPDALALVAGTQRLSYRELDRRANQIANHLRALGVGPDSVVGLSIDRSAGMIEGLLGILKAGGAYVPLDPGYPAPRLAQILEEAGSRVVVTEERFAASLPDGVAPVRLDADAAVIAAASDARPASGSGPLNLAYVLFTSGSTGKPKGVAVEHRQLVNYVRGVAERLALPADASYAHVSTFSADLGNTVLFPPLCLGGTLHVIPREMATDPDELGEYFAREEIDCLKIVPSHLSALLSGAHPERVIPRRLLVLGGEGSSWELIARVEKLAPATRIMNHYGPTETTVGVLTYPVEKGQPVPGTAIVPLGRPLPNSRVYVLDAQQRPAPIGVHGEAYIGGSGVARGYLGRPDLTAERFVRDPFASEPTARMYRTGDRVRRLADGTLVFLGRVDFQVKIRGFRIELGEIEASLSSHPDLQDVVVLALDDAHGGSGNKHLAAFVVARSTAVVEPSALAAFVAARLPDYMVPASISVLAALPLTPNGKIDRQALAALDRPAVLVEAQASAPRNPTEEVLASIWEDVFGKDQIGIDESFADLGGHSLLAIQIIARARDAFQAEISLRAIFEKPTIRGLAEVIEESVREGFGLLVPAIVSVPRGAGMELSFSQERLWFLDQLEPGSSFYNVPVGWRLRGRLDTGALERAVREVVRRHEVLRTTFTTVNGRPSQVIHADVSIRLPVSDFGALGPEAREEAAKQEALAEANRPFDLARGPLLRVKLLRLATEDHVLLLTLHHIVSDAWTRGILNTEIGALYEAFREGRPAQLAPLPIQYADYAHWQRRWLHGEVLEKQLEYWKTALDGAPRVLELPVDRPRPPVSTHKGAHLGFTLPPELAAALTALSRREGTTLFMTTLSAFSVLLHRYTGQTDILIGTPVANRAKAELESLIGFFINTLVMRAQMTDDLPFVELLARVREACLGGYAHQDMPFESLVQQLSPDRDLGRTPLFQVLFQLQAAPIDAMTLPGLTLRAAYPEVSTSKFDLTLSLMQGPSGLRGIFEYSTDLFDRSTIERMVGHLQTLLQGIVARPESLLFELPLLTAGEHATLLRGFQSGAREYPVTSAIHERFEAQVDRTPDAVAVSFEGESLSYRELDARSSQLAHHLRALGVGREVLTGICVQRSLSMVIAILGVLKAGGAYLPLDPEYPKDRLAFMVEDSKIPVIVTEAAYVASLPEHAAQVVCLDTDAALIAKQASSRLAGAASPGDLAYVIYTSGSTGKPKGAMVTHENVVRLFDATNEWYHFDGTDVWTLFHSYAFDFSVWEIWGALLYGGRLVVVPYWVSRAPDAFYKLLGDEGVTVLNQTPSAFRQLTFAEGEAGTEAQKRLQLRYVVFGGEALDLADLKPFWDRHGDRKPQLVNMYGITETTVHVTYRPVTLADLERPWSSVIGCPIPDLDVYIVDGRRNLVPIGVPGEMLVGGAGVSRGYLRRPELTAERFFPDTLGSRPNGRLYKTGDLARYLPNGDVEYLGRIDHQVKIRGFRIELGEIEAVLESHAAVREAIVLAREDGPGEKRLIGYLVCAEGQGPTVGELRAFLKEKLPEYMVPAAFVLLDALPLTSNGKVDRKALPAPEAGERLTLGESFVAPRSPVEEALSQVWAQVLRLPKVGIHDNFFELGGDSILSIQIVWRAADAGMKITPRQLFQYQTIAELAEVAGVAGASTAEQGAVTGEVPLTPIAHWWLEQKVASPSHYNQAYFLEVREALDAEAISAALGCLIEHHDALRVRLDVGASGALPWIAAIGEETPFQRIALQGVPEDAQTRAMEQTAADVQASLDLARGPALRAVLFDLGAARSNRLLIVIHHLACDGVSWRILFEDLWTAYEQRRRGETMSLPAKTTSFKRWAEKLTAHAASDALTDEAAYWTSPSRSAVWRLPVDHDRGENTEASQRAVSLPLTEEETDALLRKVPEAYRTQINDVLLSAVALALTRWTGAESALVDLEGHGREDIVDDVDHTRTVGWFTTVFPVLLDVPGREGPGEVLTSVKETLRGVPGKGLGYGLLRYLRGSGDAVSAAILALPQAEVSFNYLGQLDQAFPETSPFRMAPESVGPSHSLLAKRRYRLDVRSSVLHGKLWIRWAYSENQYRAETIAALSARVMEALRELIAHCVSPEAGGPTPSDFENANLSREDLADVMDSLDLDDEI